MRHSAAPSRSAHRRSEPRAAHRRGRRSVDFLLICAVALALVAGLDAVVLSRLSGPTSTDAFDATGMETAAVERTATAVCTLAVPHAPLTAEGLMTPYRLRGTAAQTGPCHEATPGQSAFVEAVIYDPATHGLSVYRPVVVDDGDQPAAAPVPVSLPAGAVVGIWISFNGRTLSLSTPSAGHCADGVPGSPFGTFAYCNAPAFFSAVTADHSVHVPALGRGKDGLPCPTSRDFSVVDQDQSDDVATAYRVVDGRIAQDTAASRGGAPLTTGPDNRLLAERIDPVLGCTPFLAPDLTDGNRATPALALDELLAAAHQSHAALVPGNDPQTLVNRRESNRKVNLFRAGVNQPSFPAGQGAGDYCEHLGNAAPQRLEKDSALLRTAATPAQGARNLLDYLQQRLQATAHELHCSRSTVGAVTAHSAGVTAPGSGTPSSGPTSSGTNGTPLPGSTPSGSFIAPGSDGIVWGSSVMAYPGETAQQALARVRQQMQPQVLREYNTGAPKWPNDGDTPLIISFKLPPADVIAGKDDALLQQFFAATPRPTYYTYWHEPEDDVEKGHFTAAQYRAAWAHIATIARASGKPLRATLILMGYTAMPSSHRNWRDFYPGPDVVDLIAWDSYEWSADTTPDHVFGAAQAVAAEAGKPWAVAETGVSAVAVPNADQRNQRLTALSHYLATQNPKPEFVSYFDSEPDSTWKWNVSRDPSAAAAWRAGE